MKIRYRYLRDENRNPYRVVCMDESGAWGFSYCHPDDRFQKKLARVIALGRLEKGTKAQLPYAMQPIVQDMVECDYLKRHENWMKKDV